MFFNIGCSNVTTIKEQTFHKRYANVPVSNRNKIKTFELVPKFVLSKGITFTVFGPGEQIPVSNRNNLFSIRQSRERYQKVLASFQNDIGTFVLSLLTCAHFQGWPSPSWCSSSWPSSPSSSSGSGSEPLAGRISSRDCPFKNFKTMLVNSESDLYFNSLNKRAQRPHFVLPS